jgi:hypothetical protein
MKRIVSILFALALVLGFSLVMAVPAWADATPDHYVDALGTSVAPYSTPATAAHKIQDAINAAATGDTVHVAAGMYVEDLFISPDKEGLELKGAGAATTTIKGTTVGVPGIPNINVHADGVKIHDFTIETADCNGGGWVDGLILNGVDVEIYDNHFRVVSSDDTDGGAAIQTWRSENVALQNLQYGFDPPRDSDVSGLKIYDNEFTGVGVLYYDGVFINRDNGGGLVTIANNVFTGPIHFGIANERSNAKISGNEMTSTYQYVGIAVMDWNKRAQDNVEITGNTVKGVLYGVVIGYGDGTQALTNFSVTCNTVQDDGTGIFVRSSAGGVVINNNNIKGNSVWGVRNTHSAMLDAEDNWWGDDSGPHHSSNPTGTGNPVSDNVDFTPWIDNGVTTTTHTGTASFASTQGNVVGLTAVPPPTTPPVTLPHGMFEFTICCLSPGQEVTLTVTLPTNVPRGTKWWKYHNSSWSSLPIGSDDGDNIITVTLKDGRTPDDEDSIAGQITDQGGPGAGGAVGWETYPISKVRVLLPWIALFAAIVAGASLLVLRRRRIQS